MRSRKGVQLKTSNQSGTCVTCADMYHVFSTQTSHNETLEVTPKLPPPLPPPTATKK